MIRGRKSSFGEVSKEMKVSPLTSSETFGFLIPGKVRGTVDNPQRRLKAEMFASVVLPGEDGTDISVPAAAVFLKGEKHYVFVQNSPGEFTRQEVTIGAEQAGRVLILNGLEAGQKVVTDGCIFLQQAME